MIFTSFENIIYVINKASIFINLLLVIILLFFIKVMVKLLFKKVHYDENFYVFKIKNYFLTVFLVILYFLIFILIILFFRFLRMGYSLDLKQRILLITSLLEPCSYFKLLLVFLIIINISLLFFNICKILRHLLGIELLKLHLYYSFPKKEDVFNDSLYFKSIQWFLDNISSSNLIDYLLRPLTFIALLTEDTKWGESKFFNFYGVFRVKGFFHRYILNARYNWILLPTLILYDIYFNNYVISSIFNFLPFYFIYVIWFKFEYFWTTDNAYHFRNLIKVIYDLYYNKKNVKYFKLDKEILEQLSLFIFLGLTGEDKQYGTDMSSLAFRILLYGRFTLIDPEKNLYFNENNKEFIQLEGKNKEFYEEEENIFNYDIFFYFLMILNIFFVLYAIFLFVS